MTYLTLLAGLALLIAGGEILVRGAVTLAKHLGIPTLIIGLTIIALGTSAPEIVVTVQAALTGHPDIAIGNIVGSNIANILLVLGLTALVFPVRITRPIRRRDLPYLIGVTALFTLQCFTGGKVVGIEAGMLLAALVGYIVFTIKTAHHADDLVEAEVEHEMEEEMPPETGNFRAVLYIIGGIAGLAYGADLLVGSAVTLARSFGVAEGVIGATLVAVGSSTPELVTCVIAAYRKHADIVAGNVIGSNLLNIMVGISIPAFISPLPVASYFFDFDLWVMVVALLALVIMAYGTGRVTRVMGALLTVGYGVYIVGQFL